MRIKRLAASGAVAGLVLLSIFAGAVAPANAVTMSGAWNLWDFMLTVKNSQIIAAQGPAAVAAWSPQIARNAALSANTFRSGLIYGQVGAEAIAEVVPLYDPLDHGYGLGRKVPVQPSTPTVRGGTGVRIPAFNARNFLKPKPGAVVGATIAATAFMYRADMASTGLSWFGIDAQGSVCESDEASSGFLNFVTGQDCEMYAHSQAMLEQWNADITPGAVGTQVCRPTAPGDCYRFTKYASVTGTGTNPTHTIWACAALTGSPGNMKFFSSSGTILPLQGIGTLNTRCAGGGATHNTQWQNPASNTAAISLILDIKSYCYVASTTNWNTKNCTSPEGTVTVIDEDPERYIMCQITGSDGITRSGNSETYHDTDGAIAEPNCPTLPAGVTPTHIRITEEGGGVTNVLQDESTSPEYQEYQEEFGELCAANSCFLDLIYLPTGQSCFGMGEACDGWLSDPDRDTKYQCNYGGTNEPVQECYAYANVFNTQKRVSGNPYADPKTGEDLGGATGTRYDVDLMGRPVESPDFQRACGGQSDAMNPIEWVLRPIQCGLSWAFVARSSMVESAVEAVSNKWAETAPGEIIETVAAWNLSFNVTGCAGFSVTSTYHATGGQADMIWGIPSACPGTVYAETAAWVSLGGAVVTVLSAGQVIRKLSGKVLGL